MHTCFQDTLLQLKTVLDEPHLPSSEQHSAGQDGDGGLKDHSSSPAGSWKFTQFVEGFGEEEHESALQAIYARFRGEEMFGVRGLLSEDRAAAASALAAVVATATAALLSEDRVAAVSALAAVAVVVTTTTAALLSEDWLLLRQRSQLLPSCG
jgi:hypothetical protein